MTTMTQEKARARMRTRWLKAAAGRPGGAAGLLLLDTVAAIGFAGGIAGGVSAVANGAAVLPWALGAAGAGAARGRSTLPPCARGHGARRR